MPPSYGHAATDTKRAARTPGRPLHGEGSDADPGPHIEVHHSGDTYAVAVAQRVQAQLPGSTLSQSDPVDDGESNCRVLVGTGPYSTPRMIASVMWLRDQRRNVQWVEMMAKRLAQTVADQGFGGQGSLHRLHADHGMHLDWSEANGDGLDGGAGGEGPESLSDNATNEGVKL